LKPRSLSLSFRSGSSGGGRRGGKRTLAVNLGGGLEEMEMTDDISWVGDTRRSSGLNTGLGGPEDNVFSRSSTKKREADDEEALKWAALQKLPTYDRIRRSIFKSVEENGNVLTQEVDATQLSLEDRKKLMAKIFKVTEDDNERFLLKFRERIDRCSRSVRALRLGFHNCYHLNLLYSACKKKLIRICCRMRISLLPSSPACKKLIRFYWISLISLQLPSESP
jgi:hypothetical protein